MARCQVAPPSVETSTAARRPPPPSAAVPVMVTGVPTCRTAPAAGEVIVDVGAVVSVEAVAATRPGLEADPGCTPMSANRLTVACRMRTSGVVTPPSWLPSRPHDHCTVPAPNTRAPLGAWYMVRLWVAVPGATMQPRHALHGCPAVPSQPGQLIGSTSFSGTFSVVDDIRISPAGR